MKRGIYIVLLIAVLALPVAAQEFTGNINGRVADTSGAVIPGATVTIKSNAMQGEKSALSDESGTYRFILLPQGSYTVTYQLSGFKTLVREGIIVEVGKTTTINVGLEVATLAETVTVTGESPVVDVQNATVGVNFNQGLLRDMPNARDIWVVLAATPGITVTRFDVGGSTMGTQGGYRSYGVSGQNWITLDGINTTEGSSGAGFYMDYGAFAEIQISAAANSAEVPVPGAFLNSVFKQGSNELHGEVYFDWEDDSFQGKNVTEELRNKGIVEGDKFTRYNDFNFNAGGPIQRDKFWWFLSIRDQFSGLKTELRKNDGSCCGEFTTRLQNQTIKLNYQINANNTLAFSSQGGRKFQPYRGGQGSNAFQYIVNSTYNQDSWSWVGKTQWTSVLTPKATLDVSANNFGYHFPGRARVNETPTYDDATQARRGGYPDPFRSLARRWHWNANLSYFAGSHDLKFGYGLIWEAPRSIEKPAPGPNGGGVYLYYNNGVPDRFRVDNTPNRAANFLLQNFFFVQDKWQVGRKLTFNLGMRFDRYGSYYPKQGNDGSGLFAEKTEFPKRVIAIFNNIVPRLAMIYDVFGNTKTAIKASYGRYSENTSSAISSRANPNKEISRTFAWDGTLPITRDIVARSRLLSVTGQPRPIGIDPDLSNKYTDEYAAGLDHELFKDFALNFNWVRKITHNSWDTVNLAESTNVFRPVNAIDPGPDGVLRTGDDKPFTIFERTVPAAVDDFLTNFSRGDNFSTVEFGATKRFSNSWQLITGFDWTKRNLAPNISLNPNIFLYGNDAGEHTTGWTYKLLGTYVLPHEISISGVYNAQKGEGYGREVTFSTANLVGRTTNLAQGNTRVFVEPEGTYYRPTAHIANVRFEKTFRMGDRHKIAGMFDLFNIFNANTIVGVNTLSSTTRDRNNNVVPSFDRATQIVQPRIFRLGVRYNF